MPNYRRAVIPGGTFFFTLKTEHNAPIFDEPRAIKLLGEVTRRTKHRWPFRIDACVLLPDHLHAIWSLPPGDDDFSKRWAWLKKEFTREYLATGGYEQPRSESRVRNRRRGVWQRRFWEHAIETEHEFDAYFDYVHWNPVKHGHVAHVRDWSHSTFHRWVNAGVYPPDWGNGEPPRDIDQAGE